MFDFIKDFCINFISILSEMAPYLLLGFFIAGILHSFFSAKTISKYFGGNRLKSSLNAAIFGVPLPLCSCGVIPTGMSLYKNGASKGSTVSFLISTPQTGIDSILATYSLLGLPFAIIRPIVAFVTGVLGGFFTSSTGENNTNTHNEITNTNENDNERANLTFFQKIASAFRYGFIDFLQDISKWLVIGLLLAAAISAAIPNNFVDNLNLPPFIQMLAILLISIPMYICATASVPLAAVLILKGLSPGAALVFLMAGPATNAATITMIANVMGRKSLWGYLISIIAGALAFGLFIDYALPESWFKTINIAPNFHNHSALDWVKISTGILLVLLIINGFIQKHIAKTKSKILKAQKFTKVEKIKVEGVRCNHCVENVTSNLKKLDFVKDVNFNMQTSEVELNGDKIDINKVKEIINSLGYKAK